MKNAIILLLLLSSAFACIGNANEVYISFPSVDYSVLSSNPSCNVADNQAICRFDKGTAIVATESSVSLQVPLNADGTPSFELSDWTGTMNSALQFLSSAGALDLTQEDISTIGSVTLYAGGVYGFFEHATEGRSLDQVFAASNELCTDTPVYVSDLPAPPAPELYPSPSTPTPAPQALSLDPMLIVLVLAVIVVAAWALKFQGKKPKRKKK